MDMPDSEMSDSALLQLIAADVAFLRGVIEPLLPLVEAIRGHGNGQIDAVRAAGLRKTLRRAARDAT